MRKLLFFLLVLLGLLWSIVMPAHGCDKKAISVALAEARNGLNQRVVLVQQPAVFVQQPLQFQQETVFAERRGRGLVAIGVQGPRGGFLGVKVGGGSRGFQQSYQSTTIRSGGYGGVQLRSSGTYGGSRLGGGACKG